MRCFRITPSRDPVTAFDGIRSAFAPGRWNERGRRAVYVTTRLSLGILELMVQDSVTMLRGYGAYPVDIPEHVVLASIDRADLSRTWRTAFAGRDECRAIAEAWIVQNSSVGLMVPSAVLPEGFDFGDYNIVLDPLHSDFQQIAIRARIELDIDARLHASIGPARPASARKR